MLTWASLSPFTSGLQFGKSARLDYLDEMTDQTSSVTATQPLLSEDLFQNEQSRRLFEAIDELRTCGANHDIELPEVRCSCALEPEYYYKEHRSTC